MIRISIRSKSKLLKKFFCNTLILLLTNTTFYSTFRAGRELQLVRFQDKVRGIQPMQPTLYSYIWFVFCVNPDNQIEFVPPVYVFFLGGTSKKLHIFVIFPFPFIFIILFRKMLKYLIFSSSPVTCC